MTKDGLVEKSALIIQVYWRRQRNKQFIVDELLQQEELHFDRLKTLKIMVHGAALKGFSQCLDQLIEFSLKIIELFKAKFEFDSFLRLHVFFLNSRPAFCGATRSTLNIFPRYAK